jgi:hypothetical protein
VEGLLVERLPLEAKQVCSDVLPLCLMSLNGSSGELLSDTVDGSVVMRSFVCFDTGHLRVLIFYSNAS